jgi:hypothetical protein
MRTATHSCRGHRDDRAICPVTIERMSFPERLGNSATNSEKLRQQFSALRESVHQSMRAEEELRQKENAAPTEDELYMGAFEEWLEPQVRDAIREMYDKGYATQSSGFHGEEPELQIVDGYFTIDEQTREQLNRMGVDVLRGADIGVPKNKLVTMLRFRARNPSLSAIKAQWDAIAATLPRKSLPFGVRPVCDRAEEFRAQYAPAYPSLDEQRERYYEYLRGLGGPHP